MIRVLLNVSSPALRAGLRALLSPDKTIKVLSESLKDESEADVMITSASTLSVAGNDSAGILFLTDDQLNIEELKRSDRVWGILPAE